jgi:hypothetical protein
VRARRLAAVLSVAAFAGAPAPCVRAQTPRGAVELGAARLRQGEEAGVAAVTAGGTVRHEAARYAIAAGGGVTLSDDGGATTQGLLTASVFRRAGQLTRWELGGALTGFGENGAPFAAGAYVLAREHIGRGPAGGWIGVGIGGVEDLNRWYPTRTAEVGSWFAAGAGRLTATALLVDTRSEPRVSGSRLVTDPVTYTDAALGGRRASQRLELEGRAGVRLISRGALTATGRGTRAFAAIDAAVWVTPRLAVAAALGRQLSDLARGTPDTRFASLALRLALAERSWTPPDTRIRRAGPRPSPAPTRPQLALTTDSASGPRLVVTGAQRAGRVELAATFTGWEPVTLIRDGDAWRLDRALTSGTHRVLLRLDGGPWLVPGNLPTAADDFGGSVGLLTVP